MNPILDFLKGLRHALNDNRVHECSTCGSALFTGLSHECKGLTPDRVRDIVRAELKERGL